jgi:exonuclease SbcC
MDTKELMTKKSRVREAMDWMTGPSSDPLPQDSSDSRVVLLEQQLRRADHKLSKLEIQKENLSQTCASQDAYIAQLAREFEALQMETSQKDQELEQLRSRQSEMETQPETINRLAGELEEARAQIRHLEEMSQMRQMEADRRQDSLSVALRNREARVQELTELQQADAAQLQQARQQIRQLEESAQAVQIDADQQHNGLAEALRSKDRQIQDLIALRQTESAQLQQACQRIRQLEQTAHSVQTNADRQQDSLAASLRDRDSQILELNARQEQMAAKMQELQQARQALENENHQLQSQTSELTSQIDIIRVQKELADQEMKDLRLLHQTSVDQQDTIRRLEDELNRARQSLDHMEQALRSRQEGHEQEHAVLRQKLHEKEQLFQKIAEQRDQISLELEDLQAAHVRVKNECASLYNRLSGAKEQIQTLQAQSGKTAEELELLRAQQEEATRRRTQVDQLTKELEQANQTICRQKEVLQTRQEEQAAALAAARQELYEMQQTVSRLQGQKELAEERQKSMDRLGHDLEESRNQVRNLEQTLSSRQEEYTLQKASLETAVQESQTHSRTLSAKLKESEQIRERLEQEKQALSARLNEQAASSQTAVRQAEESRTYIAALQQEGLRREKEVETLKESLRAAEQNLETQNRNGSRRQEQISQLQGELTDLRNCFQQVLEEKVTLRKQLTCLEEFETKFLASDEANHQMRIELEDLRFRLEEKSRLIERAAQNEQELRQRMGELTDKLEQKNGLLGQMQEQEEHLLRQIEAHSQTIEQARLEQEQLHREMELRQEEFDKQRRLRDEQIESLRTKLAEVSNHAQEFERLSIQSRQENNSLRETLEQTSGQLASVQAQLAQREEENQSMQKQITQLQISVDQLAETRSQLQKARRYIESMEEMLSRQTMELEMTQTQLNKHLEFARELQILSRKSEGIWQTPALRPAEPPKPAQPAPEKPQPPQTDNQTAEEPVIVTAPKADQPPVPDSDSKVSALRNQLLEQTENLRRAHETIRLLRQQKQTLPVAQPTAPQPSAAARDDEPEVSWITKPSSERNARTAVFQFLQEQEVKGFQKQPAESKPIPLSLASASSKTAPPARQAPTPTASAQESEPDEKTKSLFRKFGLLGGWQGNK